MKRIVKNMKKMFALVLAVLMVAALLAGCGSSTAETKAPETTAAPAPAAT